MGARCLAVADAFDAMTSKRSYKEAFSVEFAAKEISNQAGKQFDPQLACLFVKMIEDGQIRPRLRDAVG
jgi:HD-GYP domain-containing protein (c-di-GMP phosphodiesterase class II)